MIESTRDGCLAGRVAVVTGASSGIGRAIAVALSREGARVCAVGRNPIALAETVAAAQQPSQVTCFQMDVTADEEFQPLLRHLKQTAKLDILIHGAGVIRQNMLDRAQIEDLDLQYATNVRAPYVLTQSLLPMLTAARGQIVFLNSSIGLTANRAEVAQYAATKHALRAIADSLRYEVNPKGIRVLTVYLGRTATPMQEAICKEEGRAYHPETLLQPEDVASVVLQTLKLPSTAEVTDISIRPMTKP